MQRYPLFKKTHFISNRLRTTTDTRNSQDQRGVFYFSHSGTILKFLSFLGLFQDDRKLRHDNFEHFQTSSRKWRTSLFDTFGSNIAFTLLECHDDSSRAKIGLFVNEKLTLIPGCDSNWCRVDQFLDLLKPKLDDCDWDAICNLTSADDDDVLQDGDDDRF